jgi:UDP-glucose 4-epimerase
VSDHILQVGVTGATGFLGTVVTEALRTTSGLRVSALTRTMRRDPSDDAVRWLSGDLASPVDAAAFVRDVDTIVHLAGVNTPLTSNAHLQSDVLGNLMPTLTLVQAIREGGRCPHVVFASSGGAVYAPPLSREPVTETAATAPTSSYGIQKLAIEQYLRMAADHGWLTATVLRIGNPYGVLLPAERLQGFIGVAIKQLALGRPIRLFGDTRNVRDYVHLDDVIQLVKLVLEPRGSFEVYNVGSGEGRSVDDILRTLSAILGRDLPVARHEVAGEPRDLPPWIVLDVSKAARDLAWSPRVPFSEGLERVVREAGVAQ